LIAGRQLRIRITWQHTRVACYAGFVCQAIVNNLGPLLFLTFQRQFGISLGSLALLISLNFGIQLLTDLFGVHFADRIGYRAIVISAHILCAIGLLSMGILPFIMSKPYTGLLIAVVINGMGGGLIEVIISPTMEAIPGRRKAASMILLHSFGCWGIVLTVILSTLFFIFVGIEHWRYLAILWAIVPLLNAFLFAFVPINTLTVSTADAVPLRILFTRKIFLICALLMFCSGAAELAMAQWVSFFAEVSLGVSKSTGDLLGLCTFAALEGISRVFFGLRKGEVKIERLLVCSGLLCILCYLITVFSPFPQLSLAGCAICGLFTGIMWPAALSLSSRIMPAGGTSMFAMLALTGNIGCSGGPGLVGAIMNITTLKTGLLTAILFPALLVVGIGLLKSLSLSRSRGS
jgi:MFS family permease